MTAHDIVLNVLYVFFIAMSLVAAYVVGWLMGNCESDHTKGSE